MHIALIGYRACGKTTTGRELARALSMPFVDLDARLADAAHLSVGEIFARYGEAWFRASECVELEKALDEPPAVIALGGGTPCFPAAAKVLSEARARGRVKVVYLRATPATLRARLSGADNAHRPSLTGAGHPADEVEGVLARRAPIYAAAADATIDVDALSPAEAAQRIKRVI